MSNDRRRWWAQVAGRPKTMLGPFDDQETAVRAVFRANPKVQRVMSGLGLDGPYGNITWTKPSELQADAHVRRWHIVGSPRAK
jgi:hypothetical protein